MLAVVRPFVARTGGNFRSFLANGEQIRGWFLDYVHHDARSGATPDLPSLGRRMNEFAATVRDLLTPATA